MTPDTIITSGNVDLRLEGGGRVRAKVVSGKITFLDKEGREVRPKRVKVPEGTIASLRPLMQEAFGLFGEDQGDGYWEKLAQEAPFSPNKACNKLKRAGISHTEATRLIIQNEPRVHEALSFGRISDKVVESFVSRVATSVLAEYNRK
jgi:hypothetical protein